MQWDTAFSNVGVVTYFSQMTLGRICLTILFGTSPISAEHSSAGTSIVDAGGKVAPFLETWDKLLAHSKFAEVASLRADLILRSAAAASPALPVVVL